MTKILSTTNFTVEEIKKISPETLEKHGVITKAHKSGYVCPICGNGSGEDGTGIKPSFENGVYLYHCFGQCGQGFDNIKLLSIHYNLDARTDFVELIKRTCADFGISNENNSRPRVKTTSTAKVKSDSKELDMIHADIERGKINLEAFLQTRPDNKFRGLTLETLKGANCGFIEDWIPPKSLREVETGKRTKSKLPLPTARVIFPTQNHYMACMLPEDRNTKNKSYWKIHSGKKELFNFAALADNITVFVTEGEIDALSIEQATMQKYRAVSTCGATSYKLFLQAIKNFENVQVIILFDSDDSGKANAEKFRDALIKSGIVASVQYLANETDANKILLEQGAAALAEKIEKLVKLAEDDFQEAISVIYSEKLEDSNEKEDDLDFLIKNINIDGDGVVFDTDTAISVLKEKANFYNLFYKGEVGFFGDNRTAEMALLQLLCWATNGNYALIQQLFLKSAIAQNSNEKDNPDYVETSIKASIAAWKANGAKHYGEKTEAQRKFFADNADVMKNFYIPYGYTINEQGIFRITIDKKTKEQIFVQISHNPIVITTEYENIDTHTFKSVLATKVRGKWRFLPALASSNFFSTGKLLDLRDLGLPVDSSNALELVRFLSRFYAGNENSIPLKLMVNQCGWRGEEFITPYDDSKYTVDADNSFVRAMQQSGSFDEWKEIYREILNYPMARFLVATAFATPLLNILGERSFNVYISAPTTSGKTTIGRFAASALGSQQIVRIFNTTKNAVELACAECNDFSLIVDEKELADKKLSMSQIAHIVADGQSKGRGAVINKSVVLRETKQWRIISLLNGETPLFDSNVTGGVYTRTLQLHSQNPLIPPELSKKIHKSIKKNYGWAFPCVLNKILKHKKENLEDFYFSFCDSLTKQYPNLLPEHIRYTALISIADAFAQRALLDAADTNSSALATAILDTLQTKDEISDSTREWDWLNNWYSANVLHFDPTSDRNIQIYGEVAQSSNGTEYLYINSQILKEACDKAGFNYKKLVQDMVAAGYFVPADNADADRNSRATIKHSLAGARPRCFRIPTEKIDALSDE